MILDREFVADAISSMFERCQNARNAGGIAHKDKVNGTPIPEGWKLDQSTWYWLPPNIVLM